VDARELLTAALDAANRRDLDAIVALTAEDFEGVIPSTMSAEPDVYVGHDGIRRYFESFWDVVDDLRFELEQFDEAGGWTIAVSHATGTGRASGLPIDNVIAIACKGEGGRLRRLQAYPDIAEARRAIGS
jgi:ketosteroid isomerase-like protein